MINKKILLFDIETAPNMGAYFELYREGNIVWNEQDWYILSFAWKWLGEKTTKVVTLPDFKTTYKNDKEDDRELCKELWKLFDEAEVIIAHNGRQFDIKKSNTRFLVHGFASPSSYKIVDTKLVAKKHFRFDSNKLNDLGEQLGLGRKLETGGYQLWKDCIAGQKKAWKTMADYNKQDVVLLEKVYLALRPWMDDHPNMNLINGTAHSCPNCSGVNLQRRGYSITRTMKKQRYQCMSCAAWSHGVNEKSPEPVVR